MGDRLLMDEEEEWVSFFDEHESDDDSLFTNFIRLFDEHASLWKKKKKKMDDDEIESYYNVSVYQVLPYPPNTKDSKDFFIQKT
jgi:hypothetical protein